MRNAAEGGSPLHIGPFELQRVIAEGGMGTVWQAQHRATGVVAAMKALTTDRARDGQVRAAFRREVRAVAGLTHPNIVMVYDFGEIPPHVARGTDGTLVAGSPWLAMEYAAEGSLKDWKGHLPWPRLKPVLQQLLDGLAHAHARGVVHRDLKPGNVLLGGPRAPVQIADFGLAWIHDGGPRAETTAGTPGYMAPEQVEGHARDQGPWTDLYGLGCLAFALVCGRPPFAGGSLIEVFRAHLHDQRLPWTPRQEVPAELEEWVAWLSHRDPGSRPRFAADASYALSTLDASRRTAAFTGFDPGKVDLEAPTIPEEQGEDTLIHSVALEPTIQTRAPVPTQWASIPAGSNNDWRTDEMPDPVPLAGTGLGLFGVRAVGMVGREMERDQLWMMLRQVHLHGSPRLAIVRGPAGCGKTRLAQWLSERSHELGVATTLRAHHNRISGGRDGLVPMVEEHLGCQGLSGPQIAQRLSHQTRLEPRHIEVLTRALSRGAAGPSRVELELALVALLQERCSTRPVILWIDDVQWAQEALHLARRIMEHPAGPGVFVVVTLRDEALVDQAGQGRDLQRLTATPGAVDIHLQPLDNKQQLRLVERLLPFENELAAQITRRTAGNPLFSIQLVADLVERDLLEAGPRGFRLMPGTVPEIPRELIDFWQARVDGLVRGRPVSDALALEAAAVLGQRVDTEAWHRVCAVLGVHPGADLVDGLVGRRLAEQDPDGRGWSFVHGMLRESLEQRAADNGHLALLHMACAEQLRDDPAASERFGLHLLAAGVYGDAIEPLMQAARRRMREGDIEQSLLLIARREEALESADVPRNDTRWAEGWLERGKALTMLGRLQDGRFYIERALERAQDHRDRKLEGLAYGYLAEVAHLDGHPDQAEAFFYQSLEIQRLTNNRRYEGNILGNLGIVCMELGRSAEAEEHYRAAIAIHSEVANHFFEAICRADFASLCIDLHRYDDADEQLSRAAHQMRVHGYRRNLGCVLGTWGQLELHRQQLDAAEGAFRESLAILEDYGTRRITGYFQTFYGMLLARQQRFRESESRIDRAERIFETTEDTVGRTVIPLARACWHLQHARVHEGPEGEEEARSMAQAAIDEARYDNVGGRSPFAQSSDVRQAVRVLESMLTPRRKTRERHGAAKHA